MTIDCAVILACFINHNDHVCTKKTLNKFSVLSACIFIPLSSCLSQAFVGVGTISNVPVDCGCIDGKVVVNGDPFADLIQVHCRVLVNGSKYIMKLLR